MSKDYLGLLDDLGTQINKLASFAGQADKMMGEQSEPLCKEIGSDVYDGFTGFKKEDFHFLAWLLSDIRDIVSEVKDGVAGIDAALRENSPSTHANGSPLIPVAQKGEAASPAMLSGLITRLSSIMAEHGDMVVQVEGNDLTKVEPIIRSAKEKSSGGELRNCVFLQ